jgi:hypothetical protein
MLAPSDIQVRKLDRFLMLVRMQPDTVHRLAVVVEDVLVATIGPVARPHCAVRELAFTELHGAKSRRAVTAL